jgi:uncharacterized protein involved in exopolysaccharide biosynthesis
VERSDAPDTTNTWDWLDGLGSLWRARYPIVGATMASGVLTAGVVLMMPRSYHAVATIRVGRVMDRVLADPLHVAVALNSDSIGGRLRQAGFTDRSPEKLAEAVSAGVGTLVVGTNTVASPIVSIDAAAPTVDGAKRLALGVAQIVVDEHTKRYAASVERLSVFREQLQAQVTSITAEIADVEAGLKAFRANPTVAAPAILLMRAQLEEKQTQLLGFLREQRDFDLNLTVNSEKTTIMADPLVPPSRIRPRRTMTTLAGAASGGLLAVFWAVARDARRRRGATGAGAR